MMVALRCNPVVFVNSSNMFVFPSLLDCRYLSRIALAYSVYFVVSPGLLIRIVFGNNNFESMPHPLVTFIMSQCDRLFYKSNGFKILSKKCKYKSKITLLLIFSQAL